MVASLLTLGDLRRSGAPSRPVKQEIRDNLVLKLQNAVGAVGTNEMWGVVVNRNGVVCAVAHSGTALCITAPGPDADRVGESELRSLEPVAGGAGPAQGAG